jgi:3-deoxy-D-manno-octulosonic-acid transferase
MEDFRDVARDLGAARAALVVHTEDELFAAIKRLLDEAAFREGVSQAALGLMAFSRGAADRYLALATAHLPGHGKT